MGQERPQTDPRADAERSQERLRSREADLDRDPRWNLGPIYLALAVIVLILLAAASKIR